MALVLVAVVAAASFGVYSFLHRNPRYPFQRFVISNITNSGHVPVAAISPDGKYLLYAMEDADGLQSLWLRHLASGSNTQVVAPASTRYTGLTFSRDGSYLYFVRRDEAEHTISILYQAPMLGGAPHVLVRDVDSPIALSPDGRNIAYLRELHDSPKYDLLTANSDGSGEKHIFQQRELRSDSATVAWSPDGKTIVIPISQPSRDTIGAFLAVDVGGGKERIFGESPDRIFYSPVWLPDGSGLIVTSMLADSSNVQTQLGFVSYPDGVFHALTEDTNDYSNPSIAADGRTLIVSQSQAQFTFGIAPISSPDELKPVPLQSRQQVMRWDWMPDGRLVLPQVGSIKMVSPSGGETVVLSDPKHLSDQAVSCPNGMIVFRQIGRSGGSATANLWRVDANGSLQVQLTSGLNEEAPACSSDNQWIYYIDHDDDRHIKRVPLAGGTAEPVVNEAVGPFALSPDGKWIGSLIVRDFDHKLVLRLDSVEDHKTQYAAIDQRASYEFSFTPDSKAFVYTVRDKGVDNLWEQPLDGATARQLTHFTKEHIWGFAFSKDGAKIAIERGHVDADAVLLRDAGK